MIDVLIPTYGRADRLAQVAANVHEATTVEHRVVFVIEDADLEATRHLTDTADVIVNEHTPNYAGAIQTGYEHTTGEYLFCGSDDLRFHPGWAEAALELFDGWAGVVGTNDLINPYVCAGLHATHSLVARWYIDEIGGTVDGGPGTFLPQCYDHNYTDTEFIGTAKMRARFRPCLASVVEHLHHGSGKSAHDATYERGDRRFAEDSALYDERRDLWFSISR